MNAAGSPEMGFVLSTGAILAIGVVVFAVYGFLHLLFGGNKPVAPAAIPRTQSNAPEWLTPVLFAGMIVMGFRMGMPWWIVIFGSMFTIVMLVKMGALAFGKSSCSVAPPSMPPPLPPADRFQNATYHPSYSPQMRKAGNGWLGVVCGIVVLVGTVIAVSFVREDHSSSRNLRMVAVHEFHSGMQEAKAGFEEGMQEFKREIEAGAKELEAAAKEIHRSVKQPTPIPAPTPPKALPSPAIAPTEPGRIGDVLGRGQSAKVGQSDDKKSKRGSKPKSQPQVLPPPRNQIEAVMIPHTLTASDLAEWGTDKSPNARYIILSDPKDRRDEYQAMYQRSISLLKNYIAAEHPGFDTATFEAPPFAWAEANDLVHKRAERDGNYNVMALGLNFSPRSVDLAYNYHLGVNRTREAAKGYFGGLLLLGGLGLLLRIGTGVRPSPMPKV